ncbi:MAG: DUF6036 family nucleotidyltransferase [bacterium]|nr:DUF6036 family nucleotidyltransferase [bacterium]MDE0438260.1 DUF6036 family nucleotidyltransferase [bacterium]
MTSATGHAMTPDLVGALFEEVDNTLAPLSEPADLLVVGGAALLLRWDPARVTYDVDVVTPLPAAVEDAAAVVAARYGLSPFWLNSGALVARPAGLEPDEALVVHAGKNLTVSVAGPRYLLAMKVFAGRGTDRSDLLHLFGPAAVDSLDAVYALHSEAYPGLRLHAAAERTLQDAWADYTKSRASGRDGR